jgi:hypothetical protein
MPLMGTALAANFVGMAPMWRLCRLPALILFVALLVGVIFFVARTRDFS